MSNKSPRRQGQIVAKGKDRWLIRYFVGRDQSGRRQYRSESVVGKIGDAKMLLNNRLTEASSGTVLQRSTITVGEYLDEWVSTTAKIRVRSSTYESYKYHLEKYVDAGLRKVKLTKLKSQQVQRLYQHLSERLSPRTVRYVHSLMKSAFKKAIALRLINQNPCDHVDLPKRKKRQISVFSQEDARRFIAALGSGSRALVLELALTTGARPEEYLALKWPDIDFDRQSITFQRTIIWKKGGGWELDERMKTSHSRRTLRIPSTICAKLAALKRSQAEEILKLGPAYERNSFVFATERGTPINPRNLAQRDLKSALNEAKLGHHTLYSLRHSCATLLLAEGVNIKVIQERLGHADVSLTLSTYSHVLEGMQDQATDTIDQLLYGWPKKAEAK